MMDDPIEQNNPNERRSQVELECMALLQLSDKILNKQVFDLPWLQAVINQLLTVVSLKNSKRIPNEILFAAYMKLASIGLFTLESERSQNYLQQAVNVLFVLLTNWSFLLVIILSVCNNNDIFGF